MVSRKVSRRQTAKQTQMTRLGLFFQAYNTKQPRIVFSPSLVVNARLYQWALIKEHQTLLGWIEWTSGLVTRLWSQKDRLVNEIWMRTWSEAIWCACPIAEKILNSSIARRSMWILINVILRWLYSSTQLSICALLCCRPSSLCAFIINVK